PPSAGQDGETAPLRQVAEKPEHEDKPDGGVQQVGDRKAQQGNVAHEDAQLRQHAAPRPDRLLIRRRRSWRHQHHPGERGDARDDTAEHEDRAPAELLHDRCHQERGRRGAEARRGDIDRSGAYALHHRDVGHDRHGGHGEDRGLSDTEQHTGGHEHQDGSIAGHGAGDERRDATTRERKPERRARAEALAEHAGRHLKQGVRELKGPRGDGSHDDHCDPHRRHHALLRHRDIRTHEIGDAGDEAEEKDDAPGMGVLAVTHGSSISASRAIRPGTFSALPVSKAGMRPRALALRVAAALVPVFLLALWLAGAAPQKAPQKSPAAKAPAGHTARKVTSGEAAWREVYRLIDEDKPEEAARKVAAIRAAARAAGREREWTLALVQEAQLRVRNAPEAAILLLRDEPWPENDLDRAILHLYLGQAVDGYYTSRSWSINRREQIGAPRTLKDLDLGTATQAEMFAAMTSEYLEVWRRREALSAVSVQSLVRYVLPSDYPPDVRGTARDMVSYLFAANLADSTFWSPRESNELFRLDLARLIEGQPGSTADPADATAHPLARMASVLGDLETWHRAAGHRAAALEARLERLRLLHTAFTEEKDRALLRRSLEDSLPAFR